MSRNGAVVGLRGRVMLAQILSIAVACGTAAPRLPARADGWQRLVAGRPIPGVAALCEDRWETTRPSGGPYDRIGLHRIAPCAGAPPIPRPGPPRDDVPRPAILYLPGTHMHGGLALFDAAYEFRLHLAERGFTVWSLDYRTHFVPPDTTALDFMRAWTSAVFLDDIAAAYDAVRTSPDTAGRGIVLAGFSRGAGFAFAHAARTPPALRGLVILDGVAPGRMPVRRPAAAEEPATIDVGSRRLPYPLRQALLETVIGAPDAPTGDPAAPTAGARLADILYTSAAFGGRGGLSDPRHGCADVGVLARLLADYDRYWPSAAAPETQTTARGATPAPSYPVFAAASGNLGPAFGAAVEASARAVGGTRTTIVTLPRCGHLDVLVGADARRVVFEPLHDWLERLAAPQP
jgi:pimeloyl-ACP methyl ester carboxylesterase